MHDEEHAKELGRPQLGSGSEGAQRDQQDRRPARLREQRSAEDTPRPPSDGAQLGAHLRDPRGRLDPVE